MVSVFVRGKDQNLTEYEVVEGWTLMENLKEYGLPIKAECGGACCCATCHVYIDEKWHDKIPDMREEEEDMLDTAPGVKETSRLSCQIVMDEDLDGLTLEIADQG